LTGQAAGENVSWSKPGDRKVGGLRHFGGAITRAVTPNVPGPTLRVVGRFAYSDTRSGGVTPAQFAALKNRVAKLEKSNAALIGYVGGCLLDWKAVTQYGDGANFGYVYDDNNNPADGSSWHAL
jgi:hypothetical protein